MADDLLTLLHIEEDRLCIELSKLCPDHPALRVMYESCWQAIDAYRGAIKSVLEARAEVKGGRA